MVEFVDPKNLLSSDREPDEHYQGVIVKSGERWRIIICRSGLQFILQKRSTKPPNKGIWIGQSYCTTKDGLFGVCSHLGLLSDPNTEAVLTTLPERARDYRKK